MCKRFVKLCCVSYLLIRHLSHTDISSHSGESMCGGKGNKDGKATRFAITFFSPFLPPIEEHFLFQNIQGCKRGTAFTDAALSDIHVEGGNARPNFDMTYKII